ncbi:MAG: M20/M25/M40 family metallo-hydrolase, partial [Dehalococcoidia bacterium]
AGLLCAIQAMQSADVRPERPVWIVGTVGEEGLGNLRGARAATDRLFEGLEAVLSIEGSFFGRVSHTAVGSQRWRVCVRGEGGHSWHDFGQPSAVHALVQAAAAIAALDMPSEPRTTFNIGEFRGGTGVNVIAECAEMVLDMRSVDPVRLSDLTFRVRRILDGIRGRGISVEIERVGDRPAGAIPVTHPLVQACSAVLAHLGVKPQYAAASTDSNAPLGRGIPAVTLGVTRGGGAHTLGEWIEVAPMVRGVQQLILTLCALSGGPDLTAGFDQG